MVEGAELEVVELGIDVSLEKLIEAAKEKDRHIIGLSALLTTTKKS
jgi:5-methyltetrahydrofolate--homocysteine methyltransferase